MGNSTQETKNERLHGILPVLLLVCWGPEPEAPRPWGQPWGSLWPEAWERAPQVGTHREREGTGRPEAELPSGTRRRSEERDARGQRAPRVGPRVPERSRSCQRFSAAECRVRARHAGRCPRRGGRRGPARVPPEAFPKGTARPCRPQRPAPLSIRVHAPLLARQWARFPVLALPPPLFVPSSPAHPRENVGVPPPAAGLALLGGRGPGEVSSAPLNLSPVCLAGARSPQGAGWRVVWAPSPGQ